MLLTVGRISRCYSPISHTIATRCRGFTRLASIVSPIDKPSKTIRNPAPDLNEYWTNWLEKLGSYVHYRHGRRPQPPLRQPSGSPFYNRKKVTERYSKTKATSSTSSNNENSSEGNEEKQENDQDKDRKELLERMKRVFAISLFCYGVLYILSGQHSDVNQTRIVDTTWSDFVNRLLPTGSVSKIIVFPERDIAVIYMYAGAKDINGENLDAIYKMGIPSLSRFETEVRAAELAINLPPENWTQVEYRRLEGYASMLTIGILAIVLAGLYFLFKRVKVSFSMTDMMHNMTKTKFNIIDPHSKGGNLKIKFKDVAGLKEAKVEISEFVDYLQNPAKYVNLGAKLPKGALMTGPPGCGKTLLAKALAAESSAPFISMNGTEFVEVIGGLGASRIRALFKEAKSRAPCIIYIDEIDAIGRKRSEGGSQFGGSSEEEQTLNQLLVEMDGMDSAQGIIVIASTNRPDILDKALMRPGRFDRHVTVDLPTVIERKELFELYLKAIKLDIPIQKYSQRLAQMTPGFSGADIANVVNEAAIHAATNNKKIVTLNDLDHALQRVLAGPEKRSKVLVKEELETVAYHESGHALVGWLLEHTDALLKVSIVPRTSAALGFAQYSPKDRKLFTKEELFDRMCMTLGGRAAENIKFGRITSGAQDDLQKVTKQAYAQVQIYGMSSQIGPLSFSPSPGNERSSQFGKKPYSGQMQKMMDQEVNALVSEAYFTTEKLLRDNIGKLETLAQELLAKEVLGYEDVKKLIGPPTFGEKSVVELADHVLPDPPQEE
uniref:AAA domain-containing protein n=1 Tax=Steinernema glaseri TaxID=37863 RepID=A0A1I7YMF9_9BILA